MRALGVYSSSGGRGGVQTRLRNQMNRLFGCTVSLIYEDENGRATVNSLIADRIELWWTPNRPDQAGLWESKIELSEKFFQEIIRHPVPIDINTLTALKRSTLGLDLYLWLVYRTFPLRVPLLLSWRQVYRQFGAHPDKASNKRTVLDFRRKVLRELKKIKTAWPGLNYTTAKGVLILSPSKPRLHPRPAHSVSWSSPRDRPGATGREPGCFRWRRDDVPWQSRKPTSERTTQNRKVPSGASGGRCAGSSSRSSNWTTPIRRARNASSSARRPVNARPGATNAGRGTFSYQPNRRAA